MTLISYSIKTAAGSQGNLSPVHTSNNVEETFDFVAKTATLSKQQATKLPVASTILLRHCC